MKAIGKSADNGIKLAQLLEKAPFKDDIVKLRGFLSDIEKSTDLQGLVREGKSFTKSWDWLKSLRPKIKRSREVIEALQDILESPSHKKILGDELDDILKKFMKAHEDPKWGWNKLSFEKHMILLKKMAQKYEGVEGFNKSIRDALNNPLPAVQDGFWHMMQDLEKRGIPKEKIKAFDLEFDLEFDGDDLPCIKCKFDVELNSQNASELKYLEYKSYANASKISKPQFLNYIAKVDNIEQLQYVFNKSKLSLDEAKNGIKEFLVSNSDDMFKALNQGGLGKEKMKQLFEFGNFKFDNSTEFKNLLKMSETFRNNALKFVKTN